MKKMFLLLLAVAMVACPGLFAQCNGDSSQQSMSAPPCILPSEKEYPRRFALGLDFTYPWDAKLTSRQGFCKRFYIEERVGYEYNEIDFIDFHYHVLYTDVELYYIYWQKERIELFAGAGINFKHSFYGPKDYEGEGYINATLLGIEWRPHKDIPWLAFGLDGGYRQGPDYRPGTFIRGNILCYLK